MHKEFELLGHIGQADFDMNFPERSKNGEIIRLVCYEKHDNPYCDRCAC